MRTVSLLFMEDMVGLEGFSMVGQIRHAPPIINLSLGFDKHDTAMMRIPTFF